MRARIMRLIVALPLVLTLTVTHIVGQPTAPDRAESITAKNGESVRLMAFRSLPGAGEALWSPGGTLLAVSVRSQVLIFDATEFNADPIEFAHDDEVADMVWNPSGRVLAVATQDGQVRLWTISTQRVMSQRAIHARDLAYSPDGSSIAYVDFDDAGIYLWNLLQDTIFKFETPLANELGGAIGNILPGTGVDFSPDGRTLVAGRPDGSAIIWDVASGEMVTNTLPEHTSQGGGVIVNPDDGTAYSRRTGLIAVSNTHRPRNITIADVQAGKIKYQLTESSSGSRKTFVSVAFHPNGQLLAAAGGDYEGDPVEDGIALWDMATGRLLASLNHPNVRSVTFRPDGTQILSSGGDELRLWQPADELYSPAQARNMTNWLVDAFCESEDPQFEARHRDTIGIGWSWFAISSTLIDNHITHANYTIKLNGQPLRRWVIVTAPQREEDFFDNWTVYYYLPLGSLSPGNYEIEYRVEWRKLINDGYDIYGPGTRNPSESGTCQFVIEE